MPRKRVMQAAEAHLWLEVLLTYAFSDKSVQRAARLDLVGIAHDATAYPDDIPGWRLAQLLLGWSDKYVPANDWQRLQARVRKRRA